MKISNFMNGLRIMNYQPSLMFILLAMNTSIYAEEQDTEVELTIELLEFLGEWETEEGKWIDPIELDDDFYATLSQEQDEYDAE